MRLPRALLFVCLLLLPASLCFAEGRTTTRIVDDQEQLTQALRVKHQLHVQPVPATGELRVTDTLQFHETSRDEVDFWLNSAFQLSHQGQFIKPRKQHEGISHYTLPLGDDKTLTIHYQGKLASMPNCAWLTSACVKLDEQGVFLDGNSHWYPQFQFMQHQFNMKLELPEQWVSLSQGEASNNGWREENPQQSIYLLAGPFHVYESAGEVGRPTAMVYLQHKDDALAQRYLQATHQYIDEYSRLLGDYPYAKFATVESFWQTGWGMPSFTLLGSRVMRLPFILHSSFPHEILHNWWGNGVYVDSRVGNWSEGLTAYLADHRIKLTKGEGAAYRRDALQKFSAFTAAGGDFPLANFYSRHDRTTQAIGYGKSLMLFHMLRTELGDEVFFKALRQLYQDKRFKRANFMDLKRSFEAVSGGKDLDAFFNQWLYQVGAPQLELVAHKREQSRAAGKPLKVDLTLKQTQSGRPFTLHIPVQITDKQGQQHQQTLTLTQAAQDFQVALPPDAVSLAVDPDFDVFRLPDAREVPPAMNVLFNRQPKTFVLSRKVPEGMELAWDELVDTLSFGQENMPVQYDDEALPESGIVVLLGGDNAMLSGLLERAKQPFKLTETAYTLNSANYTCGLHSLALTLQAGAQQIILLDASTPAALATLALKLPHYGKYSYVLFNSATGENVAKGQWEVADSPLVLRFE